MPGRNYNSSHGIGGGDIETCMTENSISAHLLNAATPPQVCHDTLFISVTHLLGETPREIPPTCLVRLPARSLCGKKGTWKAEWANLLLRGHKHLHPPTEAVDVCPTTPRNREARKIKSSLLTSLRRQCCLPFSTSIEHETERAVFRYSPCMFLVYLSCGSFHK